MIEKAFLLFIKVLEIPDEQLEAFYDMASVSIGYFDDIKKYLNDNPYARKAIRLAKELNLTDEEWIEFISQLEKKKNKV